MDSMSSFKAIILFNLNGTRAIAKYYDERLNTKQFERQIYAKTKSQKTKDEVFVINDALIVHRCVIDLHIYVVGDRKENPLILDRVLTCLAEVSSTLLTKGNERKPIVDNISQFILAFDEICDQGIILETDPNLVLDRVCLRDNVAEQSLASVLQSASDQMRFPWIYRS